MSQQQNPSVKYLAIGAAVALFLGVTVWLIRNEGRRTRESIREAAREAGSEVRKGLVEGAERVVDKAAEVPGKVVREVAKEVAGEGGAAAKQVVGEAGRVTREILGDVKEILRPGDPANVKTPTPAVPEAGLSPPPAKKDDPAAAAPLDREAESPSSPPPLLSVPNQEDISPPVPQQKEQPAPARPEPTSDPVSQPPDETEPGEAGGGRVGLPASRERMPSPPAPLPEAGEGSQTPSPPAPLPRAGEGSGADPIKQLFGLGQRLSRAVDEAGQEVLALSWDEEQDVGRGVRRMVAQNYRLVPSPALIQRLERLAAPIADQRTRQELTFTFAVLKSDKVNAFAHAGGYVYVTTGMLELLELDAELQFFLAHEIAHQELRHVVKRMTYAARASQLGGDAAGTMVQMAYLAIALGYSKEQELEADAWAFRALRRAGRSRDEALSAMRHMLAYTSRKNLEPPRREPRNPAERTFQQIENHFRSHPPTAERLQQLEALGE